MSVDPEVSKYMSEMSAKRKVKRGGFQNPKVQAKIQQIKRENARAQEKKKTDTTSDS